MPPALAAALTPAATLEDLEQVPDTMVGELLDGELFMSPRPATRHARAAMKVLAELSNAFDDPTSVEGRPGGWWILPEPELLLAGDVLVPDVAGWRREHLPTFPDVARVEMVPDWVCEVLSPSTLRLDRTRKMWTYARLGVDWLWLVDPTALTAEVFQRDGATWRLLATPFGRTRARLPPFEAIEIDMDSWWVPEPTPAPT